MKTMKKKKLAVIGIAGVAGMLYSATPASAQTFYQCMPVKCKAGEYVSGGKCLQCPANTYCEDSRKIPCPSNTYSNAGATSCQVCPAGSYCDSNGIHQCAYGTYSLAGNLQCVACAKEVYYKGAGGCQNSKYSWTKMELSVGGGGCSCSHNGWDTTTNRVCGPSVNQYGSSSYGLSKFYKPVILLSCDRTTGKTYFFQASGKDGQDGFKYYDAKVGGYHIEPCQNDPIHCAYTQYYDGSVLMIR